MIYTDDLFSSDLQIEKEAMQVELPGNHKWRCYGVQLSQNGVFMASVHYPADVFCRQALKQPLKVRNVNELLKKKRVING